MIPNLDRMKREALMAFWKRYHYPTRADAAALIGDRREGYMRHTRDLANYASNRAAQLLCREMKDKTGEAVYRKICDNILMNLPPSRTWLW